MEFINNYFPKQKVSKEEKEKPEWYTACIDYIIDAGLTINGNNKKYIEDSLNILHGNIPDDFYKKTLNPYNFAEEKYKRTPATMRNLDIMNDVIRRYISEYIKSLHEFIVTSTNSDILLAKDAKLKEEISLLATKVFIEEFQLKFQEQINNGVPEEQINPQSLMPNVDEFIKDFEDNYLDDISAQAQALLKVIDNITDSDIIYAKAYFDFVSLGECYSYSDIRNNKLIKEVIPVIEAYPISNGRQFCIEHDMFARKMKMSYQQIMDMFYDDLDDKQKQFFESSYSNNKTSGSPVMINYSQYYDAFPDLCNRLSEKDRNLFKTAPIRISDQNSNLFEVWHVVWRGEIEQTILKYISETGTISEMVVDDDFVFDETLGHISTEKIYVPQVYEGYRIGTKQCGIYPIKCRPIACNRNGLLPYNGIQELIPDMGQFSIINIITPFQILRNIISYHREMVIAKNKMLILIMGKSLLGNNPDDTIYRMAADGTLLYDDSDDANTLKAQQIRLLNANMNSYIGELTSLMDSIKYEARELVDMTAQRYGEIAQSAGKGTTQEAIIRGSMGSVIVTFMFDKFREKDYQRDLDYSKIAWIDGLDTSYLDNGKTRYLSLDVNSHYYGDYLITCKNSAIESDTVNKLREWAFSAAQNGDLEMAKEAIVNDNVASISKAINKFTEIKRKHEESLQQANQQLEAAKIENRLKEIAAKGEEDRKTEEAKYLLEMQSKYIDYDLSILNNTSSSESEKNTANANIEAQRNNIEQQKIQLEREKMAMDFANKSLERKSKEKIAITNKNKYDFIPKVKDKNNK